MFTPKEQSAVNPGSIAGSIPRKGYEVNAFQKAANNPSKLIQAPKIKKPKSIQDLRDLLKLKGY